MNMRQSYWIDDDDPPEYIRGIDLWPTDEDKARRQRVEDYYFGKHGAAVTFEDGETKCQHCQGIGILNYDAGFHDTQGVCDCPYCFGTGKRQ